MGPCSNRSGHAGLINKKITKTPAKDSILMRQGRQRTPEGRTTSLAKAVILRSLNSLEMRSDCYTIPIWWRFVNGLSKCNYTID